jgi:ComF family protein
LDILLKNKLMKIREILSTGIDFALDLLFPKHCVGCQKEGVWLCEDCLKKIVFVQMPVCPNCNCLTPNGQFCDACRDKTELTGIISCCYYEEGPLKEAVHHLKYDYIKELANPLSALMIHSLKERLPHSKMIVTPVPLHRKRKAQRGFNQAELLAEKIALYFNLEYRPDLLIRKVFKKPQVELSSKERWKNIENAFVCRENIEKKDILLIDDVTTTTATLNECAKALRAQGAHAVWGCVLARG